MAAESIFFNLYKIIDNHETKLVIVKAIRPDYSNASQTQEDDAWEQLSRNREKLIAEYCAANGFDSSSFIAEWMSFPEGEVFYSDANNVELDVWIAMYKEDKPYFSFGIAETEEAFWLQLKELYDDGDCANYPELIQPASLQKITFIQ